MKRIRIHDVPAAPHEPRSEIAKLTPRGTALATQLNSAHTAVVVAKNAEAFAIAVVKVIKAGPLEPDTWVVKEAKAIWNLVERGDITNERAATAVITNLKARIGAKLAKGT